MLSSGDEEVLRNGRALMQVIVQADGRRRLLMVRDVATPAWVVMDRILDFPAYPRMVKGCDTLVPYHDKHQARRKCTHRPRTHRPRTHRGACTATRAPALLPSCHGAHPRCRPADARRACWLGRDGCG